MSSFRTLQQRSISESFEQEFLRRHERARADASTAKQAKDSLFRSSGLKSLRRILRVSKDGKEQKGPSTPLAYHAARLPDSGPPRTEVHSRMLIQAHGQREIETRAAMLNSASSVRTILPEDSIDGRRFAVYFATPAVSQCDSIHRISDAPVLHRSPASTQSLHYSTRSTSCPSRHRRTTYLPESTDNDDLPPKHAALDPYPFFDSEFGSRRRTTTRISDTMRIEGVKATTGRVGRSMLKMVTDAPSAVKAAKARMNCRRAKAKIRWLEKHNYLSGQDRALTQELVG